MKNKFNLAELMTVAAAREIKDNEIVFVGTGLPMVAIMLAKLTHAPNLKMIFEAGAIDSKLKSIPTSVGDARCEKGASLSSGLYETFSIAQRGLVDLGFLGGAEIDEYGNVNTTVIGNYLKPEIRLTGSGGNPDINSFAKRTVYIMVHEKRRFTKEVSYITSPGWRLKDPVTGKWTHRKNLYGASFTGGPTGVISTAGVFRFDEDGRMFLETYHPGLTINMVKEMCQFELNTSQVKGETEPPTKEEVELINNVIDPEEIFIPRTK
jgi:glutaconate CoA-transferase subunit B